MLGAWEIAEGRTAYSFKPAGTCVEWCCRAEMQGACVCQGWWQVVLNPAVDAAEISHTASLLHPSERSLECVSAIRGDKRLDVVLAWRTAIWAEWIPSDCYGSAHNCFYLETGLRPQRRFLGLLLSDTVSSPWKPHRHIWGCFISAHTGCHWAVCIISMSFVRDLSACVSFIDVFLFWMAGNRPYGHLEIKTLFTHYDLLFPRNAIITHGMFCFYETRFIMPCALFRQNKENLSIILISCFSCTSITFSKV